MFFGLVLALLAAALSVCAAPGFVETTSGKQFRGEVQFAPDTLIVIGTNDMRTKVALSDLNLYRANEAQPATNALTILADPPTNGLLGIYFNTPDCTGEFFKTRYDPTIDFDWGQDPPMPDMNSNRFSVRWVGQFVVPTTEHYTFHTVTDDGVRLYINNRPIIDAWREEVLNLAAAPVVLIAGQTNELRMEMFDATDRAMARLFWSSPTNPRGIIPRERLMPARNLDLPVVVSTNKAKYSPGVVTINGSLIPGQIESADRASVKLSGIARSVSAIRLARMLFQPMTLQMDQSLQRGRTGVLLRSGDFVEGDFEGFKQGELQVKSVLFGTRSIPQSQAAAVVLRDVRPTPTRFEVTTRAGALLRVNNLRLENEGAALNDIALPISTVPMSDITEIRKPEGGR